MHPSTTLKILFSLFIAATTATGQEIQGCDAVSCPTSPNGMYTCPIGNITASTIGVVNFTTSLSPFPLTWTTSLSTVSNPTFSDIWHERGYFLGLPLDVDFSSANNVSGCALFFNEISLKLEFHPEEFSDTDSGTCQDAMGDSCVAGLQSQARKIMADLFAQGVSGSEICADLEFQLRNQPPESCTFVQGGSWGVIQARDIQGPAFPAPIAPTTCHPTNGANYSLRLLDTTYMSSEADPFVFYYNFTLGVTPILTVLLPPNSLQAGEDQQNVDVNLSCVKPIVPQPDPATLQGGAVGLRAHGSAKYVFVSIVNLLSVGLSVFW